MAAFAVGGPLLEAVFLWVAVDDGAERATHLRVHCLQSAEALAWFGTLRGGGVFVWWNEHCGAVIDERRGVGGGKGRR